MAEKKSTLVIKTDLDCKKCKDKLRRILCKYHQEIRSQAYDIKNQTVIISGPFDPNNMSAKLKSKAGKVIKGIDIKTEEKKEEKKVEKKDDKPKPAAEKKDDKPKPAADKPAAKNVTFAEPVVAPAPKPAPVPGMKVVEPSPVLAYPIVQSYVVYPSYYNGAYGGTPYYEGYDGGNRVHGHYHNNSNVYSEEEQPLCVIM